MAVPSFAGRDLVAGDLLEVEAWWFIYNAEVWADFNVLWRHPTQGIGGVFRGTLGGFVGDVFDSAYLATLAEAAVVGDAEGDFAHDGAFFARDLRIASLRDTSDEETYAALRRGPPYPQQSGRCLNPPQFSVQGGPSSLSARHRPVAERWLPRATTLRRGSPVFARFRGG
jgi:hypothetical protein